MASKGRYVEGTDGSDSDFRMNVKDRYRELPGLKASLASLALPFYVFYGLALALGAYEHHTRGWSQMHLGALLGALLPYLANTAAQRNRAGLLVLHAMLCGIGAGYILYLGLGRSLTLMQIRGLQDLRLVEAAGAVLYAGGVLLHLYASYLCRQILSRIQPHQAPPRTVKGKKGK